MEIALAAVRPDSPDGLAALRAYAGELARRWPDKAPAPTWTEEFLADDPLALTPPSGIFVVAKQGDRVVGGAGLRYEGADVPPGAGEIKRMWVDPEVRGQGLGTRLLAYLTDLAREAGLRRLVLDTADDLLEARALYAREGFVETEPYNANPYAHHWYTRDLW
ncbi:GNAT family N-acetyltransferase [Actinomycetospora cinnamomea]|uniref:Acetyltransferase (GNAT) family protein n=1 Tax=Actinomycetospora cinnamomea TaxID=663609 RepID=A0A2U1FQG1_9PSEU|nr:GNAT family N-acetyltransferase [Actinomycetospora cinnamomea]PVZ14310.1 acetyltransferase (GNAT) family protein [Actinomycetospora cinnamomea]